MSFNPRLLLTLTAIMALNLAGCQEKPKTRWMPAQLQIRTSLKGSTCPCPYDFAMDGSPCGEKSAYSKSGQREPKCYENTVISVSDPNETVKAFSGNNFLSMLRTLGVAIAVFFVFLYLKNKK